FQRADLQQLAPHSRSAPGRQIGSAALATADVSFDKIWPEAESNPARLADLVLGIPLVRDSPLRGTSYARLQPLLRSESLELRQAAITAISSVPGHDTETFKTLAAAVRSDSDRAVAVASLQKIPRDAWSKD